MVHLHWAKANNLRIIAATHSTITFRTTYRKEAPLFVFVQCNCLRWLNLPLRSIYTEWKRTRKRFFLRSLSLVCWFVYQWRFVSDSGLGSRTYALSAYVPIAPFVIELWKVPSGRIPIQWATCRNIFLACRLWKCYNTCDIWYICCNI